MIKYFSVESVVHKDTWNAAHKDGELQVPYNQSAVAVIFSCHSCY